MAKGGRYLKKKVKKPASTGKKILLSLVSILLVAAIGMGIFAVVTYNDILDKIRRPEEVQHSFSDEEVNAYLNYNPDAPSGATLPPVDTTPTTEPTTVPTTLPYTESGKNIINILVVGQSARQGEDAHMADTMILVTINKDTKTMTLTSFLRDAYVDLPDYTDSRGVKHYCGEQRINVCYHLGWMWDGTAGGMKMMNACLYNNFGIDVDYNVEIDFEAFVKVINVLGGVKIELTEAEADYLNSLDLWQEVTPGLNLLYGEAALCYARMRKAEGDADSDIKRTARQRNLIKEIFRRVKDKGFSVLQDMVYEVLPYITTNMTNDEITTCIWEILPLLPELTIETGTCPVETTYWGEVINLGGYPASVLLFHTSQNRRLMMAITEGTEE